MVPQAFKTLWWPVKEELNVSTKAFRPTDTDWRWPSNQPTKVNQIRPDRQVLDDKSNKAEQDRHKVVSYFLPLDEAKVSAESLSRDVGEIQGTPKMAAATMEKENKNVNSGRKIIQLENPISFDFSPKKEINRSLLRRPSGIIFTLSLLYCKRRF